MKYDDWKGVDRNEKDETVVLLDNLLDPRNSIYVCV